MNIVPNIEKAGKSFDFPALVDYGIEKSEYLLKSEAIIASLEKIVEFWDYWQEHGVGTILTLFSLFPIVVILT